MKHEYGQRIKGFPVSNNDTISKSKAAKKQKLLPNPKQLRKYLRHQMLKNISLMLLLKR
jgi:hypothetical protein